MQCELKDCLNTDILLQVYTFLPRETLYKSCIRVNKMWEKTVYKNVYIVSETSSTYSPWKFQTIQEAVNKCPNNATIMILTSEITPFHIKNKSFIITSRNKTIKMRSQPSDDPCVIENSTIYFDRVHINIDASEVEHGFTIQCYHSHITMRDCVFSSNSDLCSLLYGVNTTFNLQNCHFQHFKDLLQADGNVVVSNCSLKKIHHQGIVITNGSGVISDTSIESDPQQRGEYGILYKSKQYQLACCNVTCSYFRMGITSEGSCLVRDSVLTHCTAIGVWCAGEEYPICCEVTNCLLTRCQEGIRCFNAILSMVKCVTCYCHVALHANECMSVLMEECCVRECSNLALSIRNTRLFRMESNAVYDCSAGCMLTDIPSCQITNNCLAYIKNRMFTFSACLSNMQCQYNYLVLTTPSSTLHNALPDYHDPFNIFNNTIYWKYKIEKSIFDSTSNTIKQKDIRINPVDREHCLSRNEMLRRIDRSAFSLFDYSVLLPIVALSIGCFLVFKRRSIVCSANRNIPFPIPLIFSKMHVRF